MEDGELISSRTHASDHPAEYDQQVAKLRDLLPKAKAFIVCLLVADDEWTDEKQKGYTHVMVGTNPGVPTFKFLAMGIEDIVTSANELLSEERGQNGGGDTTEG